MEHAIVMEYAAGTWNQKLGNLKIILIGGELF